MVPLVALVRVMLAAGLGTMGLLPVWVQVESVKFIYRAKWVAGQWKKMGLGDVSKRSGHVWHQGWLWYSGIGGLTSKFVTAQVPPGSELLKEKRGLGDCPQGFDFVFTAPTGGVGDEVLQVLVLILVSGCVPSGQRNKQNLGDFVPHTPCWGCKNKVKIKTLGAIPQTPFFFQ